MKKIEEYKRGGYIVEELQRGGQSGLGDPLKNEVAITRPARKRLITNEEEYDELLKRV